MFRFVLLSLTLLAQPQSLLAVEPTEKVAKHLGKAAIDFLQRAEKVEAFRVGDGDSTQPGAEGRIAYRKIVGEPVAVRKDTMARLVAALLSEDTYFRADSKGTKTAVGYRIWTDKKECVEVSCCLVKGNICIVVKDVDGKVIVHGDRRGFRDDRASPMRFIAAELFPDDKDVQIEQHYEPARKKNMPWGLGLQWGCAHDYANAAALQVPWVRAVAKARISEADGKLQPIKLEDGWLGDRTSIDGSFATVASWSDFHSSEKQRRIPKYGRRLDGLKANRNADRQPSGSLSHAPPRSTRSRPASGPCGSTTSFFG